MAGNIKFQSSGQSIPIGFPVQQLSPHAGIATFWAFLRQHGWIELLERCLPHFLPKSNNALTPVNKRTGFAPGLLCGATKGTRVAYLRLNPLGPELRLLGSRKVMADFSGGTLPSDGGVWLVRQVDASLGLTASLAQCCSDGRQAQYVDNRVQQLLAQRICGLVLGYEDLNDHARLRLDPMGQDRFNPAHRGVALAGASTLNRLELSNYQQTCGHKLAHDPGQAKAVCCEWGVRCLPIHAAEIVLDLDAMGHRVYGMQEGAGLPRPR